jgi:hypothetical protein
VRRQADDRLRTQELSRFTRRKIILSDVNARRTRQPREVHTVVDDDGSIVLAAQADDVISQAEERFGGEALRAKLNEPSPSIEEGTRKVERRPTGAFGDIDVDDGGECG